MVVIVSGERGEDKTKPANAKWELRLEKSEMTCLSV